MTNLKGKNLDDFFKKELSSSELPFDEANWLRLEKRLEKNNRKHTIAWLTISGIAAMLLLTLSVTYLFYSNENKNEEPLVSNIKKLPDTIVSATDSHTVKDARPNVTLVEKRETGSRPAGPAISKDYKSENIAARKTASSSVAEISEQRPAETLTPAFAELPSEAIAKNSDSAQAAIAIPAGSAESINKETTTISNVNASAKPGNVTKDSGPASTEDPLISPSRFSLSLLAGPDLNGVNNLKTNRGGVSVGLMVGYKLSNTLSITTGAVYAKKVYNSDFEYYNPNTSYKFPIDPKVVNADCRVLDIPLNINYSAWSHEKDAVALSAGISSYLMLNEQYSYTYEDPATRGPRTYYMNNRNKHYLGILNFAAGYERKVSEEVSVGIQPYLKLPITDIGYGNVKLISTGVVTSVKLNLPSKTR